MTLPTPPVPPTPTSPLGTPEVTGTTEVLPAVVQKVVAYAARDIPGVASLGAAGSRAVGAVRQSLTGSTENVAGVRVELDKDTATIGLDIAIEYGVGARELTRALRRHVPEAVEQIAGVRVTELNIVITDVALPGREEPPTTPPPPTAPAATL